MRRPIQTIAVACAFAVLALAGAGAGASVAMAAAGNAVINNCESNGQLTHQYTHQELAHALAVMPASVKQYTNCYDVIQQALVNGQGRTGTAGSSSSSSFLPTSVIVILVVLILAAITFGAIAVRGRAGRSGDDPPAPRGPADGDDQPGVGGPQDGEDQPGPRDG